MVTGIMQAISRRMNLLDPEAWRYFAAYYRPNSIRLLGYAVVASAQSLLVVPVLYLIRYAFDVVIPAGDVTFLIYVGIGIFAVRLLNGLITLYMRAMILKIIKRAIKAMRDDLVAKLYALSRQFYTDADKDHLHTQVVQDTERADNMSNTLFSGILPAAFTSLALLIVLAALNWVLLLAMVATGPIVLLAIRYSGGYVKRSVFAFQRAFEGFSKGILFVLNHMDLTRIQAFENSERERQSQTLDTLRATGEKMAWSYAVHRQVQQNVMGLAGILILVIGGASVAQGGMTIGEFLAFYVAAGLLNGYVGTILDGLPEIINGNESLVTLRRLRDTPLHEPYQGTETLNFSGAIALRNVVFGYGNAPILNNVTLEIAPGQNLAIIGANGVGKSTIVNLILGFWRPREGTILADGIPYDRLHMPSLRKSIGVVMQKPTLFAGTVFENISYGHPDATADDVRRVAKLALADEFISKLPESYGTQVGEGAIRLSGGESQRIAIARALLGNPRLLILDEPTNHLDAFAIDQLMRRICNWEQRPAILTISHDSHVIEFADSVLRLEDGRLTPLGTSQHAEAI